jgi:hypothetical protein
LKDFLFLLLSGGSHDALNNLATWKPLRGGTQQQPIKNGK